MCLWWCSMKAVKWIKVVIMVITLIMITYSYAGRFVWRGGRAGVGLGLALTARFSSQQFQLEINAPTVYCVSPYTSSMVQKTAWLIFCILQNCGFSRQKEEELEKLLSWQLNELCLFPWKKHRGWTVLQKNNNNKLTAMKGSGSSVACPNKFPMFNDIGGPTYIAAVFFYRPSSLGLTSFVLVLGIACRIDLLSWHWQSWLYIQRGPMRSWPALQFSHLGYNRR